MLPILDTPISDAKKLFDVNVFAVMAVTQSFSLLLIASKGTVINISSISEFCPVSLQGFYNASKTSVHLLSSSLRLELSPWARGE